MIEVVVSGIGRPPEFGDKQVVDTSFVGSTPTDHTNLFRNTHYKVYSFF